MSNTTTNFDRDSRLHYAGITPATGELLRAVWKAIKPALPKILDAFYAKVMSEPTLAPILGIRSVQLKQAQSTHWERLFSGTFDATYMQSVYAIGMAHKRIGLEPRWYIAGYQFILNEIVTIAVKHHRWSSSRICATVRAVNAAVLLDIDLAISAYQDAIEREKVEQANAIIASIGTGLAAMAKGDLSDDITVDLSGGFAKLKDDFNAAQSRLRGTMQSVLTSASGISTGASEISQAADDLSKRTEQQAASLEETAAALEEITATVKKTAQNAKEATVIVGTAKAAAENGGRIVETAIDAMGKIEQSSKQITDIISVIDEIAFQTNLLALNAGVEAARAGDAGKGFAVVASEVRALAQRSSDAAREIKTLIKASGEHVGSGVRLVGESGEALRKIVGQVIEINALVSEMAQAAQQQSTGIEEVNTAVTQMDQVTQQNAAMVEQSTAAARSLAGETNELSDMVSFFKVGGAPVAAVRQERPRQPAPKPPLSRHVPASKSGSPRRATALAVKRAPQAQEDEWQEF